MTGLIIIVAFISIFFLFMILRLQATPNNDPKHFQRKSKAEGIKIVACVGASTVRRQISFNFVDYLQKELKPENYEFHNLTTSKGNL